MPARVVLLLVEDEEAVALFAQTVLEDGGYSVLVATTGNNATDVLNQRIDEIAVLVTDIKLPDGPNGWEIARYARELKPDLPVIYTTADSGADWTAQGVPKSLLLQKPYVEAQLVTAVSSLLIQGDNTLS